MLPVCCSSSRWFSYHAHHQGILDPGACSLSCCLEACLNLILLGPTSGSLLVWKAWRPFLPAVAGDLMSWLLRCRWFSLTSLVITKSTRSGAHSQLQTLLLFLAWIPQTLTPATGAGGKTLLPVSWGCLLSRRGIVSILGRYSLGSARGPFLVALH